MKVLVIFFALVAFSGVWGSQPDLSETWVIGAEKVSYPVTEPNTDGQTLKTDTINAFAKYLGVLDKAIDTQYLLTKNGIVLPVQEQIKAIEQKHILVQNGQASANEFDLPLFQLTYSFTEVINLVKNGVGITTRIEHEKMGNAAASSPDQLPNYFYELERTLLLNDFALLGNWVLNTFDQGYINVKTKSSEMEKNHRINYLWDIVDTFQKETIRISIWDDEIKEHSQIAIWQQYEASRTQLWALPNQEP